MKVKTLLMKERTNDIIKGHDRRDEETKSMTHQQRSALLHNNIYTYIKSNRKHAQQWSRNNDITKTNNEERTTEQDKNT